ncbi:MAG TPA: mechanosensitive ion channel domain-containing protein [Bryobacteraceae bacterium]|nr:mechanosensitive ion channel domain-containing protein [Bryobacteraceae bacterium]
MNHSLGAWEHLEKLAWRDLLIIAGVFILARLVILTMRRILLRAAENAEPRRRLSILRISPILHLLILAATIVLVVPILVEPTVPNVLTLSAGLGLALAYTLKDYGSSVVAGFVTVMENTFQPGDWIELDGSYGEVKSMAGRAVHLVTTDDTEVIIPLSRTWSAKVLNSTSGNRGMLCIANFYLHPDHDASAVQERLAEVAASSAYRAPDSSIKVIVQEKPWGTHYRVKAYVKDSREQYAFITDLTIRSKDALRQTNTRFAQAPYAETGKS